MKKLAIWFASLSLLGLCAVIPSLAATNYAVCVGVNDYKSSYCSNGLEGCVPDAQHMTNLITSRGEWLPANVQFIQNSGATRTNLRKAISNIAAKAQSGDHFLYYHSSHGGNDNYYFTTNSGKVYLHYGLDSNGVKNYICSYDADYTAKMMATDLSAFKAGVKIVVMMDTCHSAGMFKYNATTSSRKALAAKLAEATDAEGEASDDGEVAEEPAPENSAAGFFMQAVLEQLEQIEADQVRRGLRPRTASSMATDVGWIAAADYDQYSWDGTSGGAFTEAFINGVTNKNKMCDNATYGNQDGYASFYEGWNYAKDQARGQRNYDAWDYDSDYGYYDYIWTDAQCTNTAVLNAVRVGWAGTNRPANVAPTFPSATATASGVVGGTVEYTFSASGSSPITYTLSTSVSSSLYDFENGYLVFQPAAAGTFTFTCTAANGTTPNATCVLTVTVTEPPPATPEVPSTPPAASTTSFTATWSAVSDAASYNLYVEQKVAASSSARASRAASTILSESFESDIPSTWTKSSNVAVATGKDGDGDSCVAFKGSGAYLITEAVDNPTGVSLMYKRSSNTTAWGLDISVGPSPDGPWTSVGTISSADTTWNTYETTFTASGTVYLKFTDTRSTGAAERYVDLIQVTGDSANWTPVPGYYPVSVSGTSKAVSGLTSGTEYRYSVAAVNAAGVESEPSAYVTVETAEGASAPVISVPETSYSRTLGDGNDVEFNVTASGSPTPTLALSSATAAAADYDFDSNDGYFTFTPSATGTFTFVFTASNSEGSDSATVTVTVSAAPVTVPVLMVDDVTDTTAYATWSECTGVTTYTLQLASDNQFTTGGGGSGGSVTLFSNDGTDATSAPTGWTYNVSDKASAYLLMFSGHSVVSEAVDASACTDLSVSLYIRTYGGTSQPNLAIQYSTDNGSIWTDAGTVAGASSTMAQRTLALPAAAASSALRLRFAPTTTSASVGVGIKTIVLTGTESASGGGSLISETSVSGDEYTFTGLTPYTVYYARVKGNADWSNVEEFLTDEAVVTDTAPSWKATFPATGTVDVGQFYTLANVSSYVTGSPAPTITLNAPAGLQAELEDDTFTFGAEASGSYTFTFTAANGISPDATATLVVTAVGQAPALTASQGTSVAATVGDTVEFTVTATGIPAPTVTMAATEYDAVFENGEFAFAPVAAGTYAFTFNADNGEGTDTLTVTVTVTAAPVTVPVLLVDDVTDTTAYATWSECTGVTTYTLQLASDNQFTTGGGSGGEVTLFSNDATDPSTAPTDWTYNLKSTSGSYLQLASGHYIITEAFNASACTDLSLSFYMRTYGGTTYPSVTVEYSTDNGATWSDSLGTLSAANTTMAQRTLDVSAAAGSPSVRLRIASTSTSASVGVGIKTIVLTGTESASGGGSLISETSVSGDEYTFTGLSPETTYYARVKGNANWSNVEEFTTDSAGDSAPAWSATFPATVTVDVGQFYTLNNISSYVTGSPAPTITLNAPAGLQAELEDDTFTFGAEASGSYAFTFTAANGISPDATATLVVTAVGQAPELTASLGTSVAATVGESVDFTVTATGIPVPTVEMEETEYGAIFIDGAFSFTPAAVGTYAFTFTADNGEGTDTLTVTLTASAAPVTVPTLTVTDVTDTTALATWTACDGVSSYTLQLSTNDFAAASGTARSATPILSEDFSGFSGNGTADIGSNGTLDEHTAIAGWTGFKVFTASETAKIGASSGQGWLMTPALDASGTLTVVWSAYRYGTSDKNTLLLGVSENGTDFDEETITIGDEMAGHTNTFTVSGPTVYVRWMASGSSKARFYLDDVCITASGSGGGGDPAGDNIQEFTVADTSYEFTGLTPYTVYYARVKGTSYWSNTEEFLTDEAAPAGTAPSIEAIADRTMALEDIADEFTVTATGTPAPTFSVTSSDAPVGSFTIGENNGEFSFMPETVGTFHFTVTAANGVSPDATATFAVTVTGTAPSLAAIADRTISLEDGGDEFTVTATGTPAPTFSVTSSDAPAGDYSIGENDGLFTFLAYSAGTYHFTITADNGVSPAASQSFTITVTAAPEPPSAFEQWLADHGASGHDADETAPNGHTYRENYIADIDPDDDFLAIQITNPSAGTFTIPAASANRNYTLLWTTDLSAGEYQQQDLGAGNPETAISFPVDGDWYGGLQVTLPDDP